MEYNKGRRRDWIQHMSPRSTCFGVRKGNNFFSRKKLLPHLNSAAFQANGKRAQQQPYYSQVSAQVLLLVTRWDWTWNKKKQPPAYPKDLPNSLLVLLGGGISLRELDEIKTNKTTPEMHKHAPAPAFLAVGRFRRVKQSLTRNSGTHQRVWRYNQRG